MIFQLLTQEEIRSEYVNDMTILILSRKHLDDVFQNLQMRIGGKSSITAFQKGSKAFEYSDKYVFVQL